MDILAGIIEKEQKRAEKYKSTSVEKHLEVEYDFGTLLVTDSNDLDLKTLESQKDEYLLNLTRDNTQLLFNKIWELPTERVEETIVVSLPEPKFVLPRAQRVPKAKPLTRWQQFAKDKGITKKKKDKATWDETLQKWVPLYGYKRAAAVADKDWVLEVPQNDPMKDMFAAKADVKSEKVAKNELQRLKNIARAQKVKIPRVGLPVTSDKATAAQLATAVTVARSSTASAGKFQPKLPKEKEAHGKGVSALISGAGKKRKAAPPDIKTERQNNLSIVDSLIQKQPKIDMDMAVTKQIRQEQAQRAEERANEKPGRKGKKGFGGPKGRKAGKPTGGKHSAAKPTGGKGQRNPNKRSLGRKRR